MSAVSPIVIENQLPLRRDLPTRAAGQDLLVREPENGGVHFLNSTAAVVWNCCDGKTQVQDCADQIRAAFTIPADIDVIADIREIVVDLAGRGLFEESTDRA